MLESAIKIFLLSPVFLDIRIIVFQHIKWGLLKFKKSGMLSSNLFFYMNLDWFHVLKSSSNLSGLF